MLSRLKMGEGAGEREWSLWGGGEVTLANKRGSFSLRYNYVRMYSTTVLLREERKGGGRER